MALLPYKIIKPFPCNEGVGGLPPSYGSLVMCFCSVSMCFWSPSSSMGFSIVWCFNSTWSIPPVKLDRERW
jgi:hypothetical protein